MHANDRIPAVELSRRSTLANLFIGLANPIPCLTTLRYLTAIELEDFVKAGIRQCPGLGCYLLLTKISRDDETAINSLVQAIDLDSTVRLIYEHAMESLIIKLMPSQCTTLTGGASVLHGNGSKDSLVSREYLALGSRIGAARCRVLGQRSKGGDGGGVTPMAGVEVFGRPL